MVKIINKMCVLFSFNQLTLSLLVCGAADQLLKAKVKSRIII